MKNLYCSFELVMLSTTISNPQSLTPSVINCNGATFQVGPNDDHALIIDWSVGEMPLIYTSSDYSTGLFILTNGFLQPVLTTGDINTNIVQAAAPSLFSKEEISVFPNPPVNDLQVNFKLQPIGTIRLSLVNQVGQVVYVRQIAGSRYAQTEHIPMSHFIQGSYILNMEWRSANGNVIKTGSVKIFKSYSVNY
jgi:hypothetical protein